jgi:hypothetical protein
VTFNIPVEAVRFGFETEWLGAHSSRTIMLSELRLLLAACPPDASFENYRKAIIEDNILLKQTDSTRAESVRRLRELYGLTPQLTIFHALSDLWSFEPEAQPILALLGALARDPVLRATADAIFTSPSGQLVTPQIISKAAQNHFPTLNPTTLANIGRHAASSWTQSGHLKGRTNKIRTTAKAYPTSVAYALFLGYLCGERGEGLFHTPWAQVLDAPVHTIHNYARVASQHGWLEYRHSGDVTDISFRYLLREKGN